MPSSDVSEDDDMAVTGEPSEEDDDMAVTGEPSDNVSDYEIDEEDVEARDGEEEEEEEVEEDEEEEEEEEEEPEEEPEEEEGEDEEQINADSSGSPKAADEGREGLGTFDTERRTSFYSVLWLHFCFYTRGFINFSVNGFLQDQDNILGQAVVEDKTSSIGKHFV